MPETTQKHWPSTWNTKTVTSADAQPTSPWVGEWEMIREQGYVRILTTLFSATSTGLGGTFTFQFSEDGSSAAISEARTITDFASLRDFDLLAAGKYYRVQYEPDVAMGASTVIITTQYRTEFDGFFVRLGTQEIEESNAALPSMFAYLKGFRSGGKSIGITATRGGAVLTAGEGLEVARGNVPGRTAVHLEGRNDEIDTTTDPEDIWFGGGDYTGLPTDTPETIEVFSSSTADTSAGTGARTVRITGLATSASTAYTTEDITLNGTTAVASSGSWYRVNDLRILTAGSGGTNAGTLTVRHTTTTANVFAQVAANIGQSKIAAYTVPDATTLFLTRIRVQITRASGAAGSARVLMLVREFGSGAWYALRDFEISTGSSVGFTLDIPLEIPAQADIKFRVRNVSDNDTIATAFFDGVLVND